VLFAAGKHWSKVPLSLFAAPAGHKVHPNEIENTRLQSQLYKQEMNSANNKKYTNKKKQSQHHIQKQDKNMKKQ